MELMGRLCGIIDLSRERCWKTILYVRPSQSGSVDTNWAVTVVTTFVTPLLNPFIYALRNERVKQALKDVFKKVIAGFWWHLSLARSFNKKIVS